MLSYISYLSNLLYSVLLPAAADILASGRCFCYANKSSLQTITADLSAVLLS
jgi:hypothetical protein